MQAATLLDGNPRNNFLKSALTWNPNGILNGAVNITIAGTHCLHRLRSGTCDRETSTTRSNPRVAAEVGAPFIKGRGPFRSSFGSRLSATRKASK